VANRGKGKGSLSEPFEEWPDAFADILPIETAVSPDGKRRAQFCRRHDGKIQYFLQELKDYGEADYDCWVWTYGRSSGLFADMEFARKDAEIEIPWLGKSN
jgi:hypothetical protein